MASDKYGIGYSGIGYKTADVAAVPLAVETGDEFIDAVPENAYSGEYPLARFLLLTVNYAPGSELDPLRREFIATSSAARARKSSSRTATSPCPRPSPGTSSKSVGIDPWY